jgi:hypothetical protein
MIHMNELDKLERLLQDKNFASLTTEEKTWVSQWIESEAEYENMRRSESKIRQHFINTAEFIPEPSGLNELKANLRKRTNQSLNWWQIKVPAWSTILVSLCFGVVAWWLTSSGDQVVTQPQKLVTSIVYDTVYVTTKPDTIFIQQVVYRERPVLLTKSIKQLESKNSVPSSGINMKEKEELENLLVSGSR